MATLYKTTGEIIEVEPENGTDFQLEELYSLLDVTIIEPIYLQNGEMLIVDEEGAINDSEENLNVTKTFGIVLFGNVLHCKQAEIR